MGESRSLGRPEKAERQRCGETREHESEDLQKHAAQVRHDAGKTGCGRGNEALCRSVFIIFVLRKEDWIMKRMIAAILVLCMVLCSIPVAAAASFDEFFADVPATVENDASYPLRRATTRLA